MGYKIKMRKESKPNRMTLSQFVQELKDERCTEISRILPISPTSYIITYKNENKT